jgi:glycosyltransferase involved in cell wall biosynthesis
MTVRAESPTPKRKPDIRLDASWRARTMRTQDEAFPSGQVVVSCPAPLGVGGLGRHLQEIVDALHRRGQPTVVMCETPGEHDVASGHGSDRNGGHRASGLTTVLAPLARFSPAWRIWSASVGYDAGAARRLRAVEHFVGFNGTSLAQFSAARRAGCSSLGLMSANSHFRHVIRQHASAHRQYPVEPQWATRLLERNQREYAQADRIYVASGYVWESFMAEGFPQEMISRFPLTPDPRFAPAVGARSSDTFDIVYVGSLTVHKGVPLLLDAVRQLAYPELRLVLIGGWKTRAMRRYLQRACAEDKRIEVRAGDPLPDLLRARLYVHPAYEDGFAYAPAEALACGVPVLVSEDTGMKELIDSPDTGLILPTGDLTALTEAIDAAIRGEVFGG